MNASAVLPDLFMLHLKTSEAALDLIAVFKAGVKTGAIHKGGYRKYRKIRDFEVSLKNRRFF